jgi:hypothetical protein
VVGLALAAGLLPLALSACCAPAGLTGFGTPWFSNDFAQYESALRQGAQQPGWLVHDQLTAEPHQPAFMFPLYVLLGKISAITHVSGEWLERGTEILARAALVIALWRFCETFASGRATARAALLLTLFGGGFELFAAALRAPYTGNWSYEANTFGLLFSAPHIPLALAATLELARAWLRPVRAPAASALIAAAGLGASIALLHPFHVPVLLAAVGLVGLVYWRTGQGSGSLMGAVAAGLGAAPVLWPTVQTFNFDPFWSATYRAQNLLPSPAPHELLIEFGPTLLLALGGAYALRGRVAPFGILIWLLLGAIAMYVPVPYQRRLSFGLHPALAVVAANTLIATCAALSPRRAAWLRRVVVALAPSSTVLILAGMSYSAVLNWPTHVYRSTTDLDAAARWLDERAGPNEVILADWDVSNYLAARTPARVMGGHPVATLRAAEKQAMIGTVFAHTASREVARQFGAQWLVYGPDEADVPGPPGPVFQSGPVRVYHVDRE